MSNETDNAARRVVQKYNELTEPYTESWESIIYFTVGLVFLGMSFAVALDIASIYYDPLMALRTDASQQNIQSMGKKWAWNQFAMSSMGGVLTLKLGYMVGDSDDE